MTRLAALLAALLTLAACNSSSGTPDTRHTSKPHRSSSAATTHTPTPTPTASPSGAACDTKFEQFTYHPARLHRLANCITATGTIIKIKQEPDGDDHIQIKLDPQFQTLMNAANRDTANAITRGYFIIEPDCVGGPVTQADAQGPCKGAVPPPGFPLLKVGAHLAITGPWVLDADHGHNEIHPIELVQPAP
jgi:hypothetical protein